MQHESVAPVHYISRFLTPKGDTAFVPFVDRTYVRAKAFFEARRDAPIKAARAKRAHAKMLKTAYGLTAERYEEMLAQQGWGCAICGRPPCGKRHLAVDHDHKTGAIRGLLCSLCNTSLGGFQDSIEKLAAAQDYLRKYEVRDERAAS